MRIIYTSDTHSYLFPTLYAENKEANVGLMRIAESFDKDEDTLVIDGGDTLQGSPLSKYVLDRKIRPFPQQAIFNKMKLDITIPGNHDFNYGYDVFSAFFSGLDAKLLCANLEDKSGKLDILKHIIVTDKSGLKIGFTGVVTDYVNIWEKKENLEKFTVSSAFESVEKEYRYLKDKADILVLIYHGGFERNLKTDELLTSSTENIGCKIARELGFDLILSAHQHMEIPLQDYFGTKIIQCPANAVKYAEIIIEKDCIKGEIKAPKESSEHIIEKEYDSLANSIDKWLDEKAGTIDKEIPEPTLLESALNGSHIADFFNYVQILESGADISCTSLTNKLYGFKKDLTLRDIIANYPFPNTLVVLEVGERELKAALERSAEYFTLKDGKVSISDSFLVPKVENYNYDYYLGLGYTFDISKPVGERVVRLEYNNEPIGDRKLKLCLNNYRASGTGGYEIFRECKVIKEICKDVQDLAITFLQQQKDVLSWQSSDFSVIGF